MTTTTTPPIGSPSLGSEDYPLSPVPLGARRSLLSLAPILAGFTLYSGTLFAGGLIGPSFQFWPNLVALIVIGNLILGLYAGDGPGRYLRGAGGLPDFAG